jgi:DNA polymerase-3 subunit delta
VIVAQRDVERFLAGARPPHRAALIYGRDLGLVRERAETLAGRIADRPDDPFDCAQITDADLAAAPERLEEELAALSMLGGKRLVRLRLDDASAGVEPLILEALQAHLDGRLNPEAFLLISAGELRKDSPLRRKAETAPACAVIACYEDAPADVGRLVRQALAPEGLGLDAEALELFVSRLPGERGIVRQEIERLALYLGPGSGASAKPEDLIDFLGVEPEASLAEAASDAFGGRPGAAQTGLRRAAAEGLAGASAVRAFSSHLARLRRIGVSVSGGTPLAAAVKAAQVFWKAEREVTRQARVWSLAEIERLQPQILEADIACKQTGAPDELIAERLALAIARRARRLGL